MWKPLWIFTVIIFTLFMLVVVLSFVLTGVLAHLHG